MSETALKIRLYGDPVLRKKASSVRKITSGHQDILASMAQVMYADAGVGLAAPQVGISEAMIVADVGTGLYKLINPRMVKKEGSQQLEEGCLSIPGVCVKVRRARKVQIQAQDDSGKHVTIEAEGLLACVLQHEIEHLRGKLIVDYASFIEKLKMKKRLQEINKRAKNEILSESKAKSCQLQL
jgi:peptide deformylase